MRRWSAGRPTCRIVELALCWTKWDFDVDTDERIPRISEGKSWRNNKSEITFLHYQDGSIDDFVEHSKKQIDTQIMTNLTRPTYDQRELIFFWFSQ